MRLVLRLPLMLVCCMTLGSAAVAPAQNGTPSSTPQTSARPSLSEQMAEAQDKLDLNTATPAQLKALPGMGDAYVNRVIAGRPYTAKNQLTQRGILPQDAYDKIRDQIIAHRPRTSEAAKAAAPASGATLGK